MKDVEKSKKKKKKGEKYKSAKEMCEEYEINMDQLKNIINAQDKADELSSDKFILSGNTKVFKDGTIGRAYSRAGELMVKCIEDAYKILNCPVHITGEYLMASPDEGWAGAH